MMLRLPVVPRSSRALRAGVGDGGFALGGKAVDRGLQSGLVECADGVDELGVGAGFGGGCAAHNGGAIDA